MNNSNENQLLEAFEEELIKKFEANVVSKEDSKEAQTESTEAAEPDVVRFDDLGLSEEVLKAVKDLGFESPSPIQERAIGPLLAGHDILGQAQTGTGKTAAFGLNLSVCRFTINTGQQR